MARPVSPTVRRRELASTLRRLRLQSNLTLDDAARHIEVSGATLSRIETGIRIPRARDVRDLVELYGVTDEQRVTHLVGLVAEAKEPGWWEAYSELDEEYVTLIGLEADATRFQQYEGNVVPGLLQTPDYARAYLSGAINPGREKPLSQLDIERRVEVRLKRQQDVIESQSIEFEAILDEAAFRREVGGPEVLRRQLHRLVELSERPLVSIRILPFSVGAHPGQSGGFSMITLPYEAVPDVVYVESPAGELFLERAEDLERHRRIWHVLYECALSEEQTKEALLRMASGGPSD